MWGKEEDFGIAYQNKIVPINWKQNKNVPINYSQRNDVDHPEDINRILCDYFKLSICREKIWKLEFLLVFLM